MYYHGIIKNKNIARTFKFQRCGNLVLFHFAIRLGDVMTAAL